MIEEQVQVIIASTNGIHYTDKVNKLTSYPKFSLPVDPAESANSLMLDIGCGWGRWLVAATEKNYIPVGLDLIPEFAETSLKVLRAQNKKGYAVVGDLELIPFKDNLFDLVWSFSVIQHVHYKKMTSCLGHINRILTGKGYTYLEFPNKNGLRNYFTSKKWEKYRNDMTSGRPMSVRYYTPTEYEEIFLREFGNFKFFNHSFLGIGVLKEDIKFVSFRNKILCSVSLFGSALTRIIPPLKYKSDSIYIKAASNLTKEQDSSSGIADLKANYVSGELDNLAVVSMLRCPKTGFDVVLSEDRQKVLVPEAGLYYAVKNNIPHMLVDKASAM